MINKRFTWIGAILVIFMASGVWYFADSVPIFSVLLAQNDSKNSQTPEQNSDTAAEPAAKDTASPVVLVENAVMKPRMIRRKLIGSFEPIQSFVAVARVQGDIESMPFTEGEFVEAGAVLFEIEKIRYEAALEAAKALVASNEAKIATLDAKLLQSEARLAYARNNYGRNRTLNEQGGGIVAQDSVENVKSILDAQEAEHKSIQAERLAAVAGLDASRADLKIALDDFDHTTVRAMIAGRVGRTHYTVGNFVTPESGPLVSVVQMDPIYLRFSISEKDFTTLFGNEENLKKEAKIRIELANGAMYPEAGEISFIDNKVTASTNTINVWATFKNSRNYLNPDGVATVWLDKNEETLLPAVKSTAIMFDGHNHSIYVVKADRSVERRTVEPASNDGEFQTLSSGVSEGETVIIDGTHKVRLIPGADGKIPPFFVQPTTTPTVSAETLDPSALPADVPEISPEGALK